MELRTVLIIEDNEATRQRVFEEFDARGVTLLQAHDYDELGQYLTPPVEFQMVILDWLLSGESSDLARLCLRKIRQSYFVPILIWTEQLERFKDEAEIVKKEFPEACLQAASKADVQYDDLLTFLNQWYETAPANLSSQFRQSIATAVEQALYTLAEHSADDLARGLKILISRGDSTEIDIEHAVDVLLRLVGRAIFMDEDFADGVRKAIAKLEHPATTRRARDIESPIKELHMYYTPNDDIVRVGDIVNITIDTEGQPQLFKGVVITPACDLARPRTAYLRIALIKEKTRNDKSGSDKWELTFLDKGGRVFEVCFHEILVVENQDLAANTSANQQKSVMLYNHSYYTLNHALVNLTRERRLDEPYRADLLHHFASHASRIGLPEFRAT